MNDRIDDYRSLVGGYCDGIYTEGEVVSKALELLYLSEDRDGFWRTLMPKHREYMNRLIESFDETAEPFAIKADPREVWRQMTTLKRWHTARSGAGRS